MESSLIIFACSFVFAVPAFSICFAVVISPIADSVFSNVYYCPYYFYCKIYFFYAFNSSGPLQSL